MVELPILSAAGRRRSVEWTVPEQGQSHNATVLADWLHLHLLDSDGSGKVILDGRSLNIASLIAVARYNVTASIDTHPSIAEQVNNSVEFLHKQLEEGHSIYGVTTGFGGSADTRTNSTAALQRGLLQMQLSAIVGTATPERLYATSIPEAWVRGAMLIRCNSLVRGHSAVRLSVIETLAELIRRDLIPLIPLRGSISASGDLCPLSYIAAALEGNPDVFVWTGDKKARRLVRSNKALLEAGIKPVSFEAKEGLGLLNGTAVSCSVAALALYEANHLAVMSQVLTAMAVEALGGTAESFDPFIAEVRPHNGQIEASRNIRFFLRGSRLARSHDASGKDDAGELRQDRYAIRTAAQWIGPQLEDLNLAHKQLEVELNSTTDNPLIDATRGNVHHGGNFQATAVTSSTEKTRSALQMIGKMLFAQCSELLNQNLSNGLPPNLAADEPSLSYTMKGVDINMASYMAELAFLANPMSSHVQSAEMCNQSINSMALVSARYTHMAIDVLSLMSSTYLYALCQALDLRVMHVNYLRSLQPALEGITNDIWGPMLPPAKLDTVNERLWKQVLQELAATVTKDSTTRFVEVAKSAQPVLIECCGDLLRDSPCFLNTVQRWTGEVAEICYKIFITNRIQYFANPDASPHLGAASKRMYRFVREELQIPFHRGLQDYPISNSPKSGGTFPSKDERVANTGTWISIIYEALRDGKLIVEARGAKAEGAQGKWCKGHEYSS